MIPPRLVSEAFVAMADSLVDDFDLVEFLHDLTLRAAAISGASAVGLVLAESNGLVRFMAANNESGRFMELLQLQSAEGPCLDCVRTGLPVVNADLAHAEGSWPVFAPRAARAGFQSVHAFPMRLRGKVIGALNLFGDTSVRFDDAEIGFVQALADVATIAVLQQRAVAEAEEVAVQLRGALDSRIVIEQAKGVLAQAEDITPAEAFELLRSAARSSHRKVAEVSQEILDVMDRRRGSG